MRIIYMGTPQFAVPALERMISEGYRPVAVVTAPDKPAGRGLKLKQSPVKELAIKYDIPVLQPHNLKDPDFIEQLKVLQPDLQFVVAFRMLPEQVWNMPPLGTYNLHASLLPNYRGAAPINHAVIQGETSTGLTTFKLKHEIDTGAIAFQERVPIDPDETAGELHDRMLPVGAELVLNTIKAIESGKINLFDQNLVPLEKALKSAPKIDPAFCRIEFAESTANVHNKIRGLSPYPGATTLMQHGSRTSMIKLLKSKITSFSKLGEPGEVFFNNKNNIYVCCKDGWIEILELQPSGKNRMTSLEFLNGFRSEYQVHFT